MSWLLLGIYCGRVEVIIIASHCELAQAIAERKVFAGFQGLGFTVYGLASQGIRANLLEQ